MAVLFSAVMTVEGSPDEAQAKNPLRQAFHPDLLPSIIPLPYEAPTSDPLISLPTGRGIPRTISIALCTTSGPAPMPICRSVVVTAVW
jgi:hypothetical protein